MHAPGFNLQWCGAVQYRPRAIPTARLLSVGAAHFNKATPTSRFEPPLRLRQFALIPEGGFLKKKKIVFCFDHGFDSEQHSKVEGTLITQFHNFFARHQR